MTRWATQYRAKSYEEAGSYRARFLKRGYAAPGPGIARQVKVLKVVLSNGTELFLVKTRILGE